MKKQQRHSHNCGCYRCTNGDAAYDKVIADSMVKYGFFIHIIIDADPAEYPNGMNIHTHGLPESCNHPDIQLCFPMSTQVAGAVLHTIVRHIKEGKRFEAGNILYEDVLGGGYKIKFVVARETGRTVLRGILPNKNHTYAGDIYKAQFQKLDDSLPGPFTRTHEPLTLPL